MPGPRCCPNSHSKPFVIKKDHCGNGVTAVMRNFEVLRPEIARLIAATSESQLKVAEKASCWSELVGLNNTPCVTDLLGETKHKHTDTKKLSMGAASATKQLSCPGQTLLTHQPLVVTAYAGSRIPALSRCTVDLTQERVLMCIEQR